MNKIAICINASGINFMFFILKNCFFNTFLYTFICKYFYNYLYKSSNYLKLIF